MQWIIEKEKSSIVLTNNPIKIVANETIIKK